MSSDLARALREFFQSYLSQQRSLSPHTLKSYRDTFKLLLRYLKARRHNEAPALADLDPKTILAFLEYLQDPRGGRNNSAQTRNQRLVAIQSFFKFLALMTPSWEHHAQRMLKIPIKRVPPKAVQSLNRQELETLLAQPNTATSDGLRDLALLNFLYNTGARASEAADLRLSSFDFPNRLVTIIGKGRKERITPLWAPTVRLLKLYVERHRREPRPGYAHAFFINQRARAFNRFGIRAIVKRHLASAAKKCPTLAAKRLSTHSLRHTCAVHLLESKVDPNVIKAWLGHASVESTNRYLDTDLTYKRRILEQFGPPHYVNGLEDNPKPSSSTDDLDWLDDL